MMVRYLAKWLAKLNQLMVQASATMNQNLHGGCFPGQQPCLLSTQCSHTFAFLATEQLNWSNWGFSGSSKGTLTVAAEGQENITHSFKTASPKPA